MVKRLTSSLERTVPGRSAWLVAALLSAALAFPAAAQPTPRSPAKTAPPPQAGAPAEKKLSGATRRLFKAVELNDITNVKSNIEDDADLFAVNDEGMTAADLAVDKGHFIIAHYLLSRRMLGRTPPLALVPATPAVSDSKPDTRRKRRFASPPLKPAAPQVAEAPPPPPAPETGAREKPKAEAPKAEAPPMRLTVSPAVKPVTGKKPPTPEQTVAEVAEVAEVDEAVEPPAPTQQTDKDGVSEAPAPDKPLADQSVLGFFQSLVDLVTPGGEKPPKLVKPAEDSGQEEPVEAVAEAAAGDAPMEPLPPEGDAGDPFKKTIVESIVESSDEIIVEVTDETGTGPDDPLEVVEEFTEDVPLSLDEDEQATVTAEPQAEDAPIKEEEEKGFLDRMASLFTSDDNAATGTETGKPADGDAGDKAAAPKGIQVTEYELPLPPPRTEPERKFSPKFLDNLADFLESGDEEAFNAWLPKMQVMNAEALRQQAPPSTEVAAVAPTEEPGSPTVTKAMPAPAPESAVKPPVEELSLADAPEPGPPEAKGQKTDPALEPEIAEAAGKTAKDEEPGMIKGVFNKLVDVLTPDFGSRERPERLSLDPEEKLAAAEPSKMKVEDGEEAPAYWPITEVEAAKKPVLAMRTPPRRARFKTSLNGVTLTLGRSVTLDNSFPPGQGLDPTNQCVKKNRGTTLFCLETVDWPETMKADFLVPTILYTGQKAIARYDQGIASRFHALFPSDSFKRIAQYFHSRFGKPTDAWNRSIAPFAQPRQDNPTLAWRSIDPRSGVITILEIRKYDDSRGGFPDTKRGAVMLYLANSPPIFPQVSSHELMRLSRGRLAPSPAPGAPNATPANVPADIPSDNGAEGGEAVEEAPKVKAMKDMTSEEIQAMRRKKKSAEAAKNGTAPAASPAPEKIPDDDTFALPPDPLGR